MIKRLKRINLTYLAIAVIVIMWITSIIIFDRVTRNKYSIEQQTVNDTHLVGASALPSLSEKSDTTTQASNNPTVQKSTPGDNKSPVCTQTTINHKTVYEHAPWLYLGQTEVDNLAPGRDGYVKSCGPDSNGDKPVDSVVPASDKKIYIGTKLKTTDDQ